MAAVEGKFTGKGYVIEGKGELHIECYDKVLRQRSAAHRVP